MFKKLFILVAACVLLLAAASVADARIVEKPAKISCVNFIENGAYVGDPVPGPLACQWLYKYGWHCDGTVTVTWSLYNSNKFDVQVQAAGRTFNMTPGERLNFTTVENAYKKTKLSADTYVWKIIEVEEPALAEADIEAPEAEPTYGWVLVGTTTATFNPLKADELEVAEDTTAHTFDLGACSDMSYIFENGKPVQQINGKGPAGTFAAPYWASGFVYN